MPPFLQSVLDPHGAQASTVLPVAWMLFVGGAAVSNVVMLLAGWAVWSGRSGWQRDAAVATLLHQVLRWGWPTPSGIAAALQNEALHIAMQASLLVVALIFWTAVLDADAHRPWRSIAALAATLKVCGLVCIAMMLQDTTFYAADGASAEQWGWTTAEDEQLGWGLMMTLGSLTPLGVALALLLSRSGPLDPSATPLTLPLTLTLTPPRFRPCKAPPPGRRFRAGGLRSTARDRRVA